MTYFVSIGVIPDEEAEDDAIRLWARETHGNNVSKITLRRVRVGDPERPDWQGEVRTVCELECGAPQQESPPVVRDMRE